MTVVIIWYGVIQSNLRESIKNEITTIITVIVPLPYLIVSNVSKCSVFLCIEICTNPQKTGDNLYRFTNPLHQRERDEQRAGGSFTLYLSLNAMVDIFMSRISRVELYAYTWYDTGTVNLMCLTYSCTQNTSG